MAKIPSVATMGRGGAIAGWAAIVLGCTLGTAKAADGEAPPAFGFIGVEAAPAEAEPSADSAANIARVLPAGPARDRFAAYQEELAKQEVDRAKARAAAKTKLIAELEGVRDGLLARKEFDQAADVQIAIRRLRNLFEGARPDPGSLTGYRNQVGKSFLFKTKGSTEGAVWGSDVYTDDSSLATAAVHAGVLRNGEVGMVKVTLLVPDGPFVGSDRNGVSSGNWTAWPNAYRVELP